MNWHIPSHLVWFGITVSALKSGQRLRLVNFRKNWEMRLETSPSFVILPGLNPSAIHRFFFKILIVVSNV